MKALGLAVVVVLVAAAGCSSSGSGSSSGSTGGCVKPDATMVKNVARGLNQGATGLSNAKLVITSKSEQDANGFPIAILAARIGGEGDVHVGTWAIDDTLNPGTVWSINDAARAFSQWGSMTKPGSPDDKERVKILASPSELKAKACALRDG